MPDITAPLPPAAPQAAGKPASKGPEVRSDSEQGQGFAEVLGRRMEPSEETGQNAKTEVAAGGEGESAPEQGERHAGKELPQGGKSADTLVAVLAGTTDNPEVAEQPALDVPAEAVTVAAATVQLPAALQPSVARQPAAVSVAPHASTPVSNAAVARSDTHPVAQAVHQTIAESDTGVSQPPIKPGEELPLKLGAQLHAIGREAVIERALQQAVQPQPQATPAPTQAVQTAQAAESAVPRPVLPTTTLDTPFRQPGWDQSLGERVLWLANQKLQSAEIKLNPARLGPIEIRIQLQQDQAQVSFTAQHAPVREALEAALPRLREMFSASGFDLVDVNVSQHSFAEQQRRAQGFTGSPGARDSGGSGPDHEPEALPVQRGIGHANAVSGIDLFA